MRILINSINFKPELTSTGKYAGEMAEWLAEMGHEVRVVTTPPHYPQWDVFPEYSSWRFTREREAQTDRGGNLEVIRCPVWIPKIARGWRRILYLMSFALSSWPAMARQISWRPDIVLLIEPTFFCSPQVLLVARLSGSITWLHVQDFEFDVAFQLGHFSSGYLRRCCYAIERYLMRKFDRVSAISERMIERLSLKDVDATRCVLFPNWVDVSSIFPLAARSSFRQQLGIADDAVVALYSGNMGMKQGLGLLVEASRRITHQSHIKFVFCGDGPYRETLLEMTKTAANVIVLPLQPAERLNELLNLADIHLLPQVAHAADLVMPSKLTGMMASGRPVIATAHTGTQLFAVLDGKGIVTSPGNPDAFCSAVVQLANNPDLRRRMGIEARKHAVARMSREEILSRFEHSLLRASNDLRSGVQVGMSKTLSESSETSAKESVAHTE